MSGSGQAMRVIGDLGNKTFLDASGNVLRFTSANESGSR
jgi:hypothetical protein